MFPQLNFYTVAERMMGLQHNTCIVNHTDTEVSVTITDNKCRNISQILGPRGSGGNVACIPTVHGQVTVSVFQLEGDLFELTPSATYTNVSGKSFIIKRVRNGVNIVRSTSKNKHEENDRLQLSCFEHVIKWISFNK